MLFKARETIFFYIIDGILRQAVEIELNNTDPVTDGIETEIKTPRHGSCKTIISGIKPGKNKLTCYAPVVFPNFEEGKLRPVKAEMFLYYGKGTFSCEIEIGRHRPWTIYVCQDVCADYTWGMPPGQTIKVSGEMINTQMDYIRKTDCEKEESKNRWNMNQTVELDWFISNQDEAAVKELFDREKEGRIEISATYNSNLSAMLGTEPAIRSLYFAAELWRKYNIRLATVEHIEMPTITWGMMSIYAKAGIRYFTKAWLDYNSHYLKKSWDIPLFYWQGPDNSKVLAFMDKGANLRKNYGHANFLSGAFHQHKPDYSNSLDQLHGWWIPHYENNESYPFDSFMLLGAYLDLSESSITEIDFLVEKIKRYNNEAWEYPRLVNASWSQYFEHAERFAAANDIDIPVIRGDMGASWEDWPAHYAHIVAKLKRGTEDFITAEKMVALEKLITGCSIDKKLDLLKESMKFMNLLAEHPWNGTNDEEKLRSMHTRSAWTDQLSKNNEQLFNEFKHDIFGVADTTIVNPDRGIIALNLQSWGRTGEVVVDLEGVAVDTVNLPEPDFQIVDELGSRKLSFVAKNVPAMGFKNERNGKSVRNSPGIRIMGNVMENQYYRISISPDDGSIDSLVDKKNGCELLNKSEQIGLNQFLYESDNTVYKLHNVRISAVNCGPVRSSLLIEGETFNTRVSTLITLYNDLDKISITNKIRKTPSSEPLNIYFAFPFNIPEREYHYECSGSIIKPGLKEYGGDQIKGSGQEIHAVRNFIDVSNSKMGVTLSPIDSYLFQLGGMTYDIMPDHPDLFNATLYSLVMTNHSYSEILRNQGGNEEFEFKYSLTTHSGGFNPVESMKFGWSENNPLIGIPVLDDKYDCCQGEGSLIACLTDNVLVTAFKAAEDRDGYILRLWEVGGVDCTAEIDVSRLGFKEMVACDIIERTDGSADKIENGIVRLKVSANSIETIKLK